MSSLIDRYSKQIRGMLSCYDRVIINGTLPGLCFPEGMTSYLYANKIRIFDFPQWAEPFREQLKVNAERLAQEHDLKVEFIQRIDAVRKEDRVREILDSRGAHP